MDTAVCVCGSPSGTSSRVSLDVRSGERWQWRTTRMRRRAVRSVQRCGRRRRRRDPQRLASPSDGQRRRRRETRRRLRDRKLSQSGKAVRSRRTVGNGLRARVSGRRKGMSSAVWGRKRAGSGRRSTSCMHMAVWATPPACEPRGAPRVHSNSEVVGSLVTTVGRRTMGARVPLTAMYHCRCIGQEGGGWCQVDHD